MQLPQYQKKNRSVLKICREPGCGKQYVGHPISKYCEYHRVLGNRTRKVQVYEKVNVKNFVFDHNFTEVANIQRVCDVPGCGKEYAIKVLPKQHVYPRYCEEHRNDFKRQRFVERKEIKG